MSKRHRNSGGETAAKKEAHSPVKIVIGAAAERPTQDAPHPKALPLIHFAHCRELEDDAGSLRVRDANLARAVLERICSDGGHTDIIEGWPPEERYIHLWHITLEICVARGGSQVDLSADYRALDCCPIGQRREMMELYRYLCRSIAKAKTGTGR